MDFHRFRSEFLRFPRARLAPWAGLATGLMLSAGLTGCVVSAGEITFTFMGEQEVMAQQGGERDGDGLGFEIHRLAGAEVYVLRVPAGSGLTVEPVVSDRLAKLPSFAADERVVAVINGGFFDPKNGQTTSHVISNGEVLLDPRENLDLMGNATVASYMDQILNRSEFRRYVCDGGDRRYDITFHNAPVPSGCDRLDALGAGPQLLPAMTHQQEAFWDVVDGTVRRNPIGMDSPNARSAIAITASGDLLLVMVAQSSSSSGLTLAELADFLQARGTVQALNLDGGSSASLFYNQRTYYGRLDGDGVPVERSVKSVLVVRRADGGGD
ncbi:MAG: phosphodiester glycosidase family protein [Synechococcales cyanobacterium RM1_1_8]|nr:phosphodiester glycosidase family protein [Synechococcales cyanobacterium RM1_1_8]